MSDSVSMLGLKCWARRPPSLPGYSHACKSALSLCSGWEATAVKSCLVDRTASACPPGVPAKVVCGRVLA